MKRDEMISRVKRRDTAWDIVIIGGGAVGAGVAVDASTRGFDVLLIEREDFGKGTSSRSTKLVHGGVRYLEQGNISLVMEALKERGLLLRNAPHIVHDLPFVVPNYSWWEAPFYGIGMKVYDLLAGKYNFGRSKVLSLAETLERLPTIQQEGLRGGVLYHDGQFDDTRLLTHLLATAADHGGGECHRHIHGRDAPFSASRRQAHGNAGPRHPSGSRPLLPARRQCHHGAANQRRSGAVRDSLA